MEFKSTSYSEAFKKFADWVELNEKKLNSACHCCPTSKPLTNHETTTTTTTTTTPPNGGPIKEIEKTLDSSINGQNRLHTWKHVITLHYNIQIEVENSGRQLNCELKRHLNEDKTCSKQQWDDAASLEGRWHKLWLKSLEQLVIVERTRRCPKHNSTIIGKPSPLPAQMSTGKPQRIRPISYPNNYNERLEWDYRHTLSLTGCHKENGSQIDLDSVDEQVTKNLTEFGENYELWFGKEDEVISITTHSRPPSVEPAEQPEVAKAVVTSNSNHHEDVNSNLLMLTTPSSMFSVDASKCLHNQKQSYTWRLIGPFLFAFILFIYCALFHEPHHMHKSYYLTQPPV